MIHRTVIRGMGHYVPERVLTNAELEKMVDTTDEWIISRTGIRERHIVAEDEACSDLAFHAAEKAMQRAGATPEDLTHIIVPTISPDTPCPSAASYVQAKFGITGQMTLDINAACSGFLYSLYLARAIVNMAPESVVLAAPADVLSTRTNWEDRSTCVLFGDGAGAAVIGGYDGEPLKKGQAELLDVEVSSDGNLANCLCIPGGGSRKPYGLGAIVDADNFIQMNGREVFKNAIRNMYDISRVVLERNGLTKDDIDIFVPHQANLRIIEALWKKLEFPPEKVYSNVDRYGNTSAASVPIAINEAVKNGVIKSGCKVLVSTFGAGFTWGAALLQY